MSCRKVSGSPFSDCLDFKVEFDLSGVLPKIYLTNLSTQGVFPLVDYKVWFVIKAPSGEVIHGGDINNPDFTGLQYFTAAGRWAIPQPWPQRFNQQIDWSGGPYEVTMYADVAGNNTILKTVNICRPRGNKKECKNNFGTGCVKISTDCKNAKLFVEDQTNYSYEGKTGTLVSKTGTLDFPIDSTGYRPSAITVNNFNTAAFDISFSGKGYNFFLNTIMSYDFGDEVYVIIKYKEQRGFAIWCNIDLCPLICDYQALIKSVQEGQCGDKKIEEMKDLLLVISSKMNLALIALNQPDCGYDLPELIEEIKELGGFSCNCYCNGVNIKSTQPKCCPIKLDVRDIVSDAAPDECPASFFPAEVYNLDHTAVIGTALNADDMVNLLNADPTWTAHGMAFNMGNCFVGWYPNESGIPDDTHVYVNRLGHKECHDNQKTYNLAVTPYCARSGGAPSYPMDVFVQYENAGPVYVVGHANNLTELIALLLAEQNLPANVTYTQTPGAEPMIIVTDNDCSADNEVTIFGQHYRTMAVGPNGNNTVDTVDWFDLNTAKIGQLCGYSKSTRPTQIVLHGNFAFIVESDTGIVYKINVTSPQYPTLAGTCALVGYTGSFTTPYHTMFMQHENWDYPYLIIVESKTGGVWKLDPVTNTVVATFQSAKLLGKIPRLIVNAPLEGGGFTDYLVCTEMFDSETINGWVSGINRRNMVAVDLFTFDAGHIIDFVTAPAADEAWSATYNPIDSKIYVVTKAGKIVIVDPATSFVIVSTSSVVFGAQTTGFSNCIISNNLLYLSGYVIKTSFVDLTAIALATPFDPLVTIAGTEVGHIMYMPIPNECVGLVSFIHNPVTAIAGYALYTPDGKFIRVMSVPAGGYYNAIFLPAGITNTPNGLC